MRQTASTIDQPHTMTRISEHTRQELVGELQHLQQRLEGLDAISGAGTFNEQELLELAPDIEGDELFLVTDTGRVVYCSTSMAETLGYEREALYRMSLADLDRDMTRASWLHHVSSLKKSHTAITFESKHLASDGSTIAKEIAATHITYRSRTYVLCVARRIGVEEQVETSMPTGSMRESAILAAVSEGVVVVDTKGIIVDTNAAADRLLGLPKSEIMGRSVVDPRWRIVDMRGNQVKFSDHPVTIALVEEVPVVNKRIAMSQPDGTQRLLMVNAAPMFDASKALAGAVASMRIHNVTEDNHEHVRRTARLLTLHKEISLAAARADSVNELEHKVCDTLVSSGDYALVWIGAIKENDHKVTASTASGEAQDFLLKIRMRWDDSEYGNGPIGLAARTRTSQVVSDTQDDARMHPWRKQCERAGLFSTATFPIVANDEVVSVISLYARDRNHFLEGELSLLNEIAQIYAFGVESIINREKIRRIEEESLRTATIVSALRDTVPTAYALFDARAPYTTIDANRAFCAMCDQPFRKSGVTGSFLSDFLYTHMQRDLYDRVDDAAGGADLSDVHEEVWRSHDGDDQTWHWRILPISVRGEVSELLYVARPAGAAVHSPAIAPVLQSPARHERAAAAAAPAAPASATAAAPAIDTVQESLLCVQFPTPGARTRKDKRLDQFFADGTIVLHNAQLRTLAGVKTISDEAVLQTVIDPASELGAAIGSLLTAKESALTAQVGGRTLALGLTTLNAGDGTSRAWITMLPTAGAA
jgi:PAS domain S-box-containing protein